MSQRGWRTSVVQGEQPHVGKVAGHGCQAGCGSAGEAGRKARRPRDALAAGLLRTCLSQAAGRGQMGSAVRGNPGVAAEECVQWCRAAPGGWQRAAPRRRAARVQPRREARPAGCARNPT